MLFNSYVFVFAFLPIALGGFFAASHLGRRVAGCWLIAASLFFYGWWNPSFTPLLITSIVGNYAAARLLHRLLRCPRRQNAVLALAIAANLAALIHYKYLAAIFGFLRIHGITDIAFTDPILPLGISFFTFTQIGYLLDCSNGMARDRSPLNYTLFVTFFPHLIAGPIVHNREIMPQFADPATYRVFGAEHRVGLGIFLIGLLKKCLLADPCVCCRRARFRAPGRADVVRRLARRAVLFAAALFRFLRLFRHGDRSGAHVQRALPAQFQLALQGAVGDRILAALAHDADALSQPVSVRSALRFAITRRRRARAADQSRRAGNAVSASPRWCCCRPSSPWHWPASGTAAD